MIESCLAQLLLLFSNNPSHIIGQFSTDLVLSTRSHRDAVMFSFCTVLKHRHVSALKVTEKPMMDQGINSLVYVKVNP